MELRRQKTLIWTFIFLLSLGVVISLATGWNVRTIPSIERVLGTIGFLIIVGSIILLFAKALREMRLNQLQTDFLAAISHELKTPVATLQLSSALLQELYREEQRVPNDRILSLWSSHDQEIQRLKRELESLLTTARWESGGAPKVLRKKSPRFGLETWLEERLPEWRAQLGTNALLRREGVPLEVFVQLDLRLLGLICSNLIENSRKFAQGNPCVVVRTERPSPHLWRIHFQDEGWGFEPQDRKRIFKRFFRSKNLSSHAVPGTGLGLYLAQVACRSMKLKLTGKSEGRGRGSTFTLEGVHS